MAAPTAMQWDPSTFWKQQDFQQSARLHMQHWIWNYQLGYAIHPKIGLSDKPPKIADVACGNGDWLLEVSRNYSQAEYHGFDITPNHFPAAAWLPSNVHLHVWNAFIDVPEEYLGAFDVVHIRAIYSAILDNKVEPLLRNLLQMLKPGGYLQWDENDSESAKVQAPIGVKAEAMETVLSIQHLMGRQHGNILPDWLYSLSPTLQQNGCEIVASELIEPRPELSRAWNDNLLTVWMGVISMLPEQAMPLPRVPGLPESISRHSFGELVMKAAAETKKGAWRGMDQRVVVARKLA